MIQYRRISLLMMCTFNFVTSVLAEEPLPDSAYSDQQLLEAGWTEVQIAEFRATKPNKPAVTENIPESAATVEPFHSVFGEYKSFEYLPDTDWRKANDEVGRIGGWKSYARQVQQAQKQEAIARDEKKP